MRKLIVVAAVLVTVTGGVASVMAQQSQNPAPWWGWMLWRASVADGAGDDGTGWNDGAGNVGQYATAPRRNDRDSCSLQFVEQPAAAHPRDSSARRHRVYGKLCLLPRSNWPR